MKILLALLLVVAFGTAANAQDFEKDGNYITLGIGTRFNINLNANYHSYKAFGPLMFAYERGITDILGIGRIGVGGGIAYSTSSSKYTDFLGYESTYRSTDITVLLKGAYHFEFDIPKMDVYAGVGIANHFYSYSDEEITVVGTTTTSSTDMSLGHYVYVGIRYYFTDAFGVYAEAGHGVSSLNGGLVFAF